MESSHSVILQKPLLSMLRIYVANKLVSQYGIATFTRESIDCIAIHIFQNLIELMISMKRILAAQRRTIPNLLHFLFVCESSGYHLDNFITYLVQKAEQKNYKFSTALNRNGIKNLFHKFTFSQENKYEDFGHSNILFIPQNFAKNKQIQQHPLKIKMPISLCVEKPESYSYTRECQALEREYKNSSQLMNKQMLARKNIKESLSVLKKKVNCQESDKNENQISNHCNHRIKSEMKSSISFELAKYL